MNDEIYKWDPVGGLVRDALYRFPKDRTAALNFIVKNGPATPEAAAALLDEADAENDRPTSDGVGRSDELSQTKE